MIQARIRKVLLSAGIIGLLAASANAATITYSAVFPLGYPPATQTTNWNTALELPKFDPSLGTLNSILVELEGSVGGRIRLENEDATPATVTANLTATITLTRPDNSVLVVVLPLFSVEPHLDPFDDVFDYGGTSGITYNNLSASDSESILLTLPGDLALFTGPGTISLPISAAGKSSASGGGNVTASFNTSAGAIAKITYNYSVEVPEPATMASLGGALIALAAFARRRRQ